VHMTGLHGKLINCLSGNFIAVLSVATQLSLCVILYLPVIHTPSTLMFIH
jgi:hypothetical protein